MKKIIKIGAVLLALFMFMDHMFNREQIKKLSKPYY